MMATGNSRGARVLVPGDVSAATKRQEITLYLFLVYFCTWCVGKGGLRGSNPSRIKIPIG